MPRRMNGCFVTSLVCLLSLIAMALPASADVTRLEFTLKQPFGTFRSGDYVIWQGKVHGDLSPAEAIPGIDKAGRNERGRGPLFGETRSDHAGGAAHRQRRVAGGCAQPRPRL